MAINVTNTSKAGTAPNVLIYGPSGCGKTTLCSTLSDPVIVTSEKGNLSINDHSIDVIEVYTLEDMYEALRMVKKSRHREVCLDSGTDIAETALAKLKKKYKDGRVFWDHLNSGMADLIRQFRDLEKRTYIIAEQDEYETAAGLIANRPAMPGKTLLRKMPHFFDVVLKMEMGKVDDKGNSEPYLVSKQTPQLYAKDRSRKLNKFEPADLGAIFDKLSDGEKKKKKKKKKE